MMVRMGSIMRTRTIFCIGLATIIGSGSARAAAPGSGSGGSPKQRAIAFLSREVPRWAAENKCFSCHNNGDAARALYAAVRLSYRVDRKALDETTGWLAAPRRWKHNGGDGPFSDKTLADLQFAAALAEAVRAGTIGDDAPLIEGAALVAGHQQPDGSWQVDAGRAIGSPATWGRALATAMCRRVLKRADAKRFRKQIARAGAWLRRQRPKSVIEAAAVLLGTAEARDKESADLRDRCLAVIKKGQADSGGWGPYVNSAPEPFDTAVVLLALSSLRTDDERDTAVAKIIERGRRSLIESQSPDGSWPETTRPAGAESYAQRLSTAGWATHALLATRPPKSERESRDDGM